MFGTAYFGTTHYGPAYFPPGDIIIEDEFTGNGAGGNYGGRALPTLNQYEERVKKLLDEEAAQRLNEQKQLKRRLLKIEAEKLLVAQQAKIRQKQEVELKSLIVSESLLQVEKDLAEINRKRAAIKLKARIMRDDDEVMLLIYG